MQINPPFGYSEIVPLYKNQKVRLPAPGALPEFAVACRDYPLAFITTDQSKTFLPVAVLGVTGGENLFLRDGQWDGSVYQKPRRIPPRTSSLRTLRQSRRGHLGEARLPGRRALGQQCRVA